MYGRMLETGLRLTEIIPLRYTFNRASILPSFILYSLRVQSGVSEVADGLMAAASCLLVWQVTFFSTPT